MNNTIIAVYGRSGEGKSTTVQNVSRLLSSNFPNAICNNLLNPNSPIDYSSDILVTFEIGEIKIGVESQGDPDGRMFKTLDKLASIEKCNIIICTSRTGGSTVKEIDRIAVVYNYHNIWMSSFYTPKLNKSILNMQAAKNIIAITEMLIGNTI